MKAIVLVGGFGTRLHPLTLTTPKQMLPVVDRPMIEHVVAGLGARGVDEAVLSLGYREDVFRAAYPDGECAGVALHYAVEPEPLDTAGAIRFAADSSGVDGTFVVVNGDVITDADLGDALALHSRTGAEATLMLTPVDDPSRYGVVPTDDDGLVLGFVEKPPRDEAPTNWINAGTYVMEPEILERITPGRRVSVEREVFPAVAAEGRLRAVKSDAYWVDAGTPATYLQIQLDLLDGRRGPSVARVDPGATVTAEASVGTSAVLDRAEIASGATVDRSVVMQGVRVGPRAIVRASVLHPDAEICAGAVVEESLVGPGTIIGDGARLTGGCVVGAGETVPAGAVLDGARVPESI